MITPTVRRGFSDEYGSWKIICISRRSGLSCARVSVGNLLLAAGAAGVIAPLWPVPEPSPLLHHLHERLRAGDAPDLALQSAQLRLLDVSDPPTWAAFTHHG